MMKWQSSLKEINDKDQSWKQVTTVEGWESVKSTGKAGQSTGEGYAFWVKRKPCGKTEKWVLDFERLVSCSL